MASSCRTHAAAAGIWRQCGREDRSPWCGGTIAFEYHVMSRPSSSVRSCASSNVLVIATSRAGMVFSLLPRSLTRPDREAAVPNSVVLADWVAPRVSADNATQASREPSRAFRGATPHLLKPCSCRISKQVYPLHRLRHADPASAGKGCRPANGREEHGG